jgi:hypothetical protein
MDLFALVDSVARKQANARINMRFGGGGARWPKRTVPEVSYDEDANDEDFAIRADELLGPGEASPSDLVRETVRMNEMLRRRRIGEETPARPRTAQRNRERPPGRRRVSHDEDTDDVDDVLGPSHSDMVRETLRMNEMLRRRRRGEETPARPRSVHRNRERPLGRRRDDPIANEGTHTPNEDSDVPVLVLDDSEDERDRAPNRIRNRELEGLLRVHGGRDTLGASAMMNPPALEKRAVVPVVPYSPPVHVARPRQRPEDTPLRDGHVGVERFRTSGIDAYSENVCPICMEPVTKEATGEHEGFLFGCRHVLHRECIADMRRANLNTCPSCRQRIQWNISARFNAGPRRRRDDQDRP